MDLFELAMPWWEFVLRAFVVYVALLVMVWTAALGGLLFRTLWLSAPRWLYTAMYLLMGCSALGWIGAFYTAGGPAVVALILGLMSVRRPRQQILAGIAIGISASAIAGIVISWVSNLVIALTYS